MCVCVCISCVGVAMLHRIKHVMRNMPGQRWTYSSSPYITNTHCLHRKQSVRLSVLHICTHTPNTASSQLISNQLRLFQFVIYRSTSPKLLHNSTPSPIVRNTARAQSQERSNHLEPWSLLSTSVTAAVSYAYLSMEWLLINYNPKLFIVLTKSSRERERASELFSCDFKRTIPYIIWVQAKYNPRAQNEHNEHVEQVEQAGCAHVCGGVLSNWPNETETVQEHCSQRSNWGKKARTEPNVII